MTVRRSERIKQIKKFVMDNPFCSLDSIFTKGEIPKSVATVELVNQMAAKNTIQVAKTKNGKNRYFIESKKWNRKTKWNAFEFSLNDAKIKVRSLSKQSSMLENICEKYLILLNLRLKVLQFEDRYAKKLGKSLDSSGMQMITKKLMSFASNITEHNIKDKISKLEKWLDFEISRDSYYLEHEAKSLSILKNPNKEISPYDAFNKQFQISKWTKRNRSFQPVKTARLIRPVSEKLDIVKDRHAYGISRPNQIYHKDTLKSKKSGIENEYDEVFKKLNAERHRIIYKNPDITENQIMTMVTEKRLTVIDQDHSKSLDYEQETKNLSQFIKGLENNPAILHDLE